ncbi:MAG: ribosomal L7Ae/L30e/S12e/Gadd45 family protein [Bacillota bacterium]|nr:ribosomal L7Ae/L30e/S12e/Gadd45 family protein [Bacillota bacterium]
MLQKIKTMLGFASKAGKLSCGQEQVIRSVRMQKAHLVILALDVSEASKKKIRDKCTYYEVAWIELLDRADLSKCIGKTDKTCVAINDQGFAETILRYYEEMQSRAIEEFKGGVNR